MLIGFDGSTQWTQGNGYLPLHVVDGYTGDRVPLDIGDVDLLSHSPVSNILSLGKLLRGGFDFHLTDRGRRCYAVTPGGAHKLKVSLGVDDILRLRHSLRTGSDRVRITQPSGVSQLSRRAHDATSSFLYDFFNRSIARSVLPRATNRCV